jgi:hypothetical protein
VIFNFLSNLSHVVLATKLTKFQVNCCVIPLYVQRLKNHWNWYVLLFLHNYKTNWYIFIFLFFKGYAMVFRSCRLWSHQMFHSQFWGQGLKQVIKTLCSDHFSVVVSPEHLSQIFSYLVITFHMQNEHRSKWAMGSQIPLALVPLQSTTPSYVISGFSWSLYKLLSKHFSCAPCIYFLQKGF